MLRWLPLCGNLDLGQLSFVLFTDHRAETPTYMPPGVVAVDIWERFASGIGTAADRWHPALRAANLCRSKLGHVDQPHAVGCSATNFYCKGWGTRGRQLPMRAVPTSHMGWETDGSSENERPGNFI